MRALKRLTTSRLTGNLNPKFNRFSLLIVSIRLITTFPLQFSSFEYLEVNRLSK
nr:MAG TPA: hypothetical protein [Caudoviricetes sp.]